MSDIELVIKISESKLWSLKNEPIKENFNIYELASYIDKGKPLPKGHGRLGDLDELTQRITNYIEHNEHMMDELTLLQEKFILEGIKDTHTIIEADKDCRRIYNRFRSK